MIRDVGQSRSFLSLGAIIPAGSPEATRRRAPPSTVREFIDRVVSRTRGPMTDGETHWNHIHDVALRGLACGSAVPKERAS